LSGIHTTCSERHVQYINIMQTKRPEYIQTAVLHIKEDYSTRCWIMVQRVRIAGSVLVGNFLKIHFQAFPSSFHTRNRCSSISPHRVFFLTLGRCCSSSLRHPSSSLLASGSLSLRPSSSLITVVLRLSTLSWPALPCQNRVRATSLLGVYAPRVSWKG
jgi:hypothetical protein